MSALLTKILGDLRRRRLQASVIVIIVALTAGVGTLGVEILNGASSPFDSAFEQNAGAHVQVLYHNTVTNPDTLTPTTHAPDVTASAGPWPSSILPFAYGTAKTYLRVVGRSDPGGPVDRLHLVAGHGGCVRLRNGAAGRRVWHSAGHLAAPHAAGPVNQHS